MPDLIKLLIRNAAIGFAGAAAFVALLLLTDTNGLGTLISQSESGLIATGMLIVFLGLTFASLQMGAAVMLAGRDKR
jgi:hypothetical protein